MGIYFQKHFSKTFPRNLIEREIVQYEIHRIIIRKRFIINLKEIFEKLSNKFRIEL